MSDNYAARQGDEIIHSSLFADITSVLAEGMAYAAIGSAVAAAATVAARCWAQGRRPQALPRSAPAVC
ncbi:Uncharacterised protein [Pseudescherichia vulneris]|nr:Uncharacterised protein [Pseudescherichia vulneris]